MNWFQEFEATQKISNDAAYERERTGMAQTTPRMERKTFSRKQWKEKGRIVTAFDTEAKRIITARVGNHKVYLFSLEQTEAL